MNAQTIAATPALGERADTGDLGGLLGLAGQRSAPFPLRELRVRASIVGNVCRTVVEQLFDNPYDTALEAVHMFPLPEDGAVTHLELRAGDVTVRAECREREEASRMFAEAREQGKRAALLDRERADVHTLRVTNIPPRASVSVRIVLVERLVESDGSLLWRFPTVIAPRYTPGEPIGHDGPGATPDTSRVPDASRLQPPLLLGTGARLDLEVEISGGVSRIESSLHAVRAAVGRVVKIAPSARATLDRDFVLRFAPAADAQAPLRAFGDGDCTMVIVNLPPAAGGSRPVRVLRDAVFVIDISGSMAGVKLESAKRAVSAALHGLECGDRFRLIAFDTGLEVFRAGFAEYTGPALGQADEWLARLEARGGTEMLPALRAALGGERSPDRLRTVLFVTDGEATNEDELIAAVSRQAAGAAVFTVGIDTAVNASLLKRVARAGHGTCELLAPGDDIEEAIARLEARFGSPVATNVTISSGEAARRDYAVLFEGRPECILLRHAGAELTLSADTPNGRVTLACPPVEPLDVPLAALWARDRVAWLDDQLAMAPEREAEIKAEMLPLALAHHIASRYTSFVAIEEKPGAAGDRITVVQPAALPYQWSDGVFGSAGPDTDAWSVRAVASMSAPRYLARALFNVSRDAVIGAPPPRVYGQSSRRRERLSVPPAPPAADAGPIERESESVRRRVESGLAVSQDAGGSFGGSVGRTSAAIAALVLLGHTRTRGSRRRVVVKAVAWLASQPASTATERVLDALAAAESAGGALSQDEIARLFDTSLPDLLGTPGPEAKWLEEVLRHRW